MAITSKFDPDMPSLDTLAGIYVCVEGAEEVVGLQQPPAGELEGNGKPTNEQLIGVYICMEAKEVTLASEPSPQSH